MKEPTSGEYAIIVRCVSADPIPLRVQLKSGGKVVFQHAETLVGAKGDGWILHIRLTINADGTADGKLVSLEPLSDKRPETIVETQLARQRAVPFASTAAQGSPEPSTTVEPTVQPGAWETPQVTTKPTPTTTTPPTNTPAPSTGSAVPESTTIAPVETATPASPEPKATTSPSAVP